MEDKECVDLEQELYKYYDTPFHKKSDDLIDEIAITFKNYGFFDKYLEFKQCLISKLELTTYIHEVLLNLDEYARHDLNHMWAMLSDKNCWCGDYEIGNLVHEELLKVWYPEEYK